MAATHMYMYMYLHLSLSRSCDLHKQTDTHAQRTCISPWVGHVTSTNRWTHKLSIPASLPEQIVVLGDLLYSLEELVGLVLPCELTLLMTVGSGLALSLLLQRGAGGEIRQGAGQGRGYSFAGHSLWGEGNTWCTVTDSFVHMHLKSWPSLTITNQWSW